MLEKKEINARTGKPKVTIKNEQVKRFPGTEKPGDPPSLSDLGFAKIVKSVKKTKKTGFEVADIYPAQKVLMMVYVLLGYLPKYISENKWSRKDPKTLVYEYYKMIASYVLYGYFFNSKAAINMHFT